MTLIDEFRWYYKTCQAETLTAKECCEQFQARTAVVFKGSPKDIYDVKTAVYRLGFGCYADEELIFLVIPPDQQRLVELFIKATLNNYPAITLSSVLEQEDNFKTLTLQRAITGTVSGMIVAHNWREKLQKGTFVFGEIK